MNTTIDHQAEKDRSYGVRRQVLGYSGRDGAGLAVTLRTVSNGRPGTDSYVEIPAGTVCDVRTSNAGFRGIECSATAPDGSRVHGVSLGAFAPVAS